MRENLSKPVIELIKELNVKLDGSSVRLLKLCSAFNGHKVKVRLIFKTSDRYDSNSVLSAIGKFSSGQNH